MDEPRLDLIARAIATGVGRRQIVAGVTAVVLGGLVRRQPAAAACKKAGRRCDRDGDCCEGARCRQGECACRGDRAECGGSCVKLDRDERHCGACGNACRASETCCDGDCADLQADTDDCGSCDRRCGPGETCADGVCTTADGCAAGADSCSASGRVECGEFPSCACSRSTEGATFCGATFTSGAVCGQCETSADCAAIGPDALCVVARASSGPCCGPEGGNVCRLPCSALGRSNRSPARPRAYAPGQRPDPQSTRSRTADRRRSARPTPGGAR